VRTARAVACAAVLALTVAGAAADEIAVYRATGAEAGLFDQYDNDGYSLGVARESGGTLELSVRVSGAPLSSHAPFPTGTPRDASLPVSPERDTYARSLVEGATTETGAVERILEGVATTVRYDADRTRKQDPASVYASKRAFCVGFAELAVDLLRRVGIPARTVQGILRTRSDADGYDSHIGGVYHPWIQIYFPDLGFRFSGPAASINGVDSRYIAFRRRELERPRGLTLTSVETSGRVDYPVVHLPDVSLRIRPVAK